MTDDCSKQDIISNCFICFFFFFLTDKKYVYNLLKKCNIHMKVYLKEEIPERFHYRHNKRIQPIILVADEGWTIVQNESLLKCKSHFLIGALCDLRW